MTELFNDLQSIRKQIRLMKREKSYSGILCGAITAIGKEGMIRVQCDTNPTNNVSYWLKPVQYLYPYKDQLLTGMRVLYCYPDLDIEKGVYFAFLDLDILVTKNNNSGITEDEVNQLITDALDVYDTSIKSWVTQEISNSGSGIQGRTLWEIQSRIINEAINYNQAGTYDFQEKWAHKHVNIMVNDHNYPSAFPAFGYLSPKYDRANLPSFRQFRNSSYNIENYEIRINTTNAIEVGYCSYLRNESIFDNLIIRGDYGSFRINGSSSTAYLIPPYTCWKLNRDSYYEFTMTQVDFDYLDPDLVTL